MIPKVSMNDRFYKGPSMGNQPSLELEINSPTFPTSGNILIIFRPAGHPNKEGGGYSCTIRIAQEGWPELTIWVLGLAEIFIFDRFYKGFGLRPHHVAGKISRNNIFPKVFARDLGVAS